MAVYPSALEPESIFAKDFRVVRGLRIGGMGAVYVVTQLSTGKQRALKLLASQLVNNSDMRERFVREAQAAADIDSDHVVEIVTAGVDDETGTPYIVMELLKGEELADAVDRRGAFPLGEVRAVLEQIGDALRQAHAQRIVHRDLKPENIFLASPRRRGLPFTAKLLDFGVAKFLALGASEMGTAPVGSPLFMAPEQTDAFGNICPATDVWALGLLAFYLLTGRSYWLGAERASVPVLLREVCLDPLVAASARAHQLGVAELIPEGFDGWFGQCVVREIERRYAEGGEAVDAFLQAVPEDAGPDRSEHPPALLLDDYDPYAIPPSGPFDEPGAFNRTSAAPPPSKPIDELGVEDVEPEADAIRLPEQLGSISPAELEPLDPVDSFALPTPLEPIEPHEPHEPHEPLEPVARDRPTPPGLPLEPPKSPPSAEATVVSTKRRTKLKRVALGIALGTALGGLLGVLTRAPKRTPDAASESEKAGRTTESSADVEGSAAPKMDPPAFSPCPRSMILVPGDRDAGPPNLPYCFDRTEVTVHAWERCAAAGVCDEPSFDIDYPRTTEKLEARYRELCNVGPPRAAHPANCIDWWSAATYCRWAGGRLPTESEWLVVRALDVPMPQSKVSKVVANRCGEECLDWGLENGIFIRVDNHESDGFEGTSPVGTYPRAKEAPVDLDGNVAEWTLTPERQSEGRGEALDDAKRVAIGEAFMDLPHADATAGRVALPPSTKSPLIGFRCVVSPSEPAAEKTLEDEAPDASE